ncbi:hypothetical protein KCP76_25080 [Salmonella enterica subsp. enterica serovar Weltevreden]|nr:hypothetical protein KCP76_25080 [Salmonella enterica subsp. enterica serovar Weltevreden]
MLALTATIMLALPAQAEYVASSAPAVDWWKINSMSLTDGGSLEASPKKYNVGFWPC